MLRADGAIFYPTSRRFKVAVDSTNHARITVQGRCYATLEKPSMASAWPGAVLAGLGGSNAAEKRISTVLAWYRRCKDLTLPGLALNEETPVIFHNLMLHGDAGYPIGTFDFNIRKKLPKVWPPTDREPLESWVSEFIKLLRHLDADTTQYLCIINSGDSKDVAWVPKTAQAGDRVCVIGGAPLPFVIRPYDDGSFKLIGEAYTACGTLKEVLGGECLRQGLRPSSEEICMSWNTDDEVMASLMESMGWITLR